MLALPVTVFDIVEAVVDAAGAICISAVKMRDHNTEVYQPNDNVDHSNIWTLIGEGVDSIDAIVGWSFDSGKADMNSFGVDAVGV